MIEKAVLWALVAMLALTGAYVLGIETSRMLCDVAGALNPGSTCKVGP